MSTLMCSYTDWAIFGLTLVGIAYLYSTWTFNYWKKRGVQFIKPFPLLGNLKESTLAKISMGEVYLDIYFKLKEFKYGGMFSFRKPTLMVCDPNLIKMVMTKDFSHFHDNDIFVTIDMDPMFGRNPFVLRGERWKTVRSQLTPAFTPGKLKPLFPLVNEVCSDMKTYLEQEYPEGLEAREVAAKFTTDVTATCIFGLSGKSFTDPNAIFRSIGRELMFGGFWHNIKVMIVFFAPGIAKIVNFKLFTDRVANFFRSVTKDAMDYRIKNNVVRNDFLQLLMQLKTKGTVEDNETSINKTEKFTDEDVAAQAATFFTDGSETSSTTLSFALYELAANPDVQERLRYEVDAAMEKHKDKLSYEMVQEIPYAEMVLAEALRKYPPAPFLTRVCSKAYDLPPQDGSTLHVEVGTSVAIPVLGLQMDPEYFPEPERFDPERFNEENKASRHQYVYMPFGAGPRACLGSRFANMQMKAGLASIISNFELQLCERMTVPLTMDPTSFLMLAKGGLWLKFIKRSDK